MFGVCAKTSEQFGIWGGMTLAERKKARKRAAMGIYR